MMQLMKRLKSIDKYKLDLTAEDLNTVEIGKYISRKGSISIKDKVLAARMSL